MKTRIVVAIAAASLIPLSGSPNASVLCTKKSGAEPGISPLNVFCATPTMVIVRPLITIDRFSMPASAPKRDVQ